MIIFTKYNVTILLPPRCASNSIIQMVESVSNEGKLISTPRSFHHVKVSEVDFDFSSHTIFLPYRPLKQWVTSCYSKFKLDFPEHAGKISFDKFVLNKGIDYRGDYCGINWSDWKGGFEWFNHSPENLLLNRNGEQVVCKELILIEVNHLENLFWKLNKMINIPIPNLIYMNEVTNEKIDISESQLEMIREVCCPLKIVPENYQMFAKLVFSNL